MKDLAVRKSSVLCTQESPKIGLFRRLNRFTREYATTDFYEQPLYLEVATLLYRVCWPTEAVQIRGRQPLGDNRRAGLLRLALFRCLRLL